MSKSYPLQKRLRYWQKRLNLLDWAITAEWEEGLMEKTEKCGEHSILLGDKEGSIVLDASYRTETYQRAERLLVHELLHVLFEFWRKGDDGVSDQVLEQSIEQVARALVD